MMLLVGFVTFLHANAAAGDSCDFPNFALVQRTTQEHFADLERGANDLVTREEVQSLLAKMEKIGWDVTDAKAILSLTLPNSHALVRVIRSKRGQQFERKVSGYKLIFDWLERITSEPGGQRLVQDIIKLRDGHRYAKQQTGGFVPDLVSMLPKKGNGRKRQIANYKQPTGNLYTPADILARLRESHTKDAG